MRSNLSTVHQPTDKPAPLLTLDQVVQWGGSRLSPGEVERLRKRIPTCSIRDVISELVGTIVDERHRLLAETRTSFTAPPKLRGSLADGYTADEVNTVLGQVSDLAGVRVICLWDYFDGEFGGQSSFYVEDDEAILELGGELWDWLTESPDSPDCPATPGNPAEWFGCAAPDFRTSDIAYDDGLHNYALGDHR
ncbi:hypothetical protein A9X06_04890 [Mycobacterium sp. 852002-51759_SCH5129042]|nr:hypothetical protein A9X06_04890 [Mycobacterium sp. 852002-51759_SCH5129042]